MRGETRTFARPLHPGRTLLFSYLLGPLGLWATPSGRSSSLWLTLGVLSLAVAVFTVRRAGAIEPDLVRGSGFGALWLLVAIGAVIGLAAAWARSVQLGGRDAAPFLGRMPRGLSNSWLVGLTGWIFPGLGLHFAGRSRRGAGVILGVGAAAVGGLILHHAGHLWIWNRVSRYGVIPERILEVALMGAAVLVVIGILVWIIQALDGIRMAQRKSPAEPRDHGDRFAMALLAASVLFVTCFRPGLWAAELDARAEGTGALGQKIIPALLAEAATRLDPSRPEYALRAAEFQAALGNTDRSRAIEARLEAGWLAFRVARSAPPGPPDGSSPPRAEGRSPDLRIILSGPLPEAAPDTP